MINKQRICALTLLILLAAASRLLPHPQNVAPIAAMALFAGAKFERKLLAFALPLIALLVSDAIIGFYSGMGVVYAAFAVVTCIGFALRGGDSAVNVVAASLLSSVVFFLITNCSFFIAHTPYPDGITGLIMGYEAGIPFFRNTMLGDVFYNMVLFGSFAMAERRFSTLRSHQLAVA